MNKEQGHSWIKREKEAIWLQVLIQLYPSNSRFNNYIHILNIEGFDFLLKKIMQMNHTTTLEERKRSRLRRPENPRLFI